MSYFDRRRFGRTVPEPAATIIQLTTDVATAQGAADDAAEAAATAQGAAEDAASAAATAQGTADAAIPLADLQTLTAAAADFAAFKAAVAALGA